jgi:hypothetical protein
MHPRAILQSMALLTIANGTALIAEKIFGCHFARPRTLAFGSSISGRSLVGGRSLDRQKPSSESYGGDLFSGFLKHHLNLLPSSPALGLDQVPESLFALLACRYSLSLTAIDIVVGIGFLVGELVLSRRLIRRTYATDHTSKELPRVISSAASGRLGVATKRSAIGCFASFKTAVLSSEVRLRLSGRGILSIDDKPHCS